MTERQRRISEGSQEETSASGSARLSRRRLLAGGAAAIGGLALGGAALAGATTPEPVAAQGTPASTARRRGGTLTVGSLGSTTDALDPNKTSSNMDLQRLFNLYDTLTYFPHDKLDLQYGLAESIELTSGASVATIRLRDGVTFHNGKPLTADDLMFTFRRILEPSDPHKSLLRSVNPDAMQKMDKRTVRLRLNFPDSIFAERFYVDQMVVVPVDFDPAHPVGTGPFMYKSFVPGQRSVFVRNPNYWISGQPYLDQLVIIDMADPTSQINALLSGQVDAIDSVPLNETSAISGRSNLRLLEANGGYFQPIVMRVDQAPFNDVRVRQAFRLLVDRTAMVKQVYNGFGVIGNDMPCPSDPAYPSSLPQRTQDIAQARSLLKAAGHADLAVRMVTANEDFGLVPGAEVFVQNAKQAGVTVTLDVIPASVYNPKFLEWPFTQGYWGNKPFGIMFSLLYYPGGIFNETHFNDAKANQIFEAALRDTNPSARDEKFRAIEQILYERGGHIIHSFRTTVDAYSTRFTGFVPDKATGWSLGQYRYREVSLA
jgi:peptide/nickel transport system substrate-binding protein